MHVEVKFCNSAENMQLYKKETPTQVLSCEYSKSFKNSFFYRTTPVAAFELYCSIRKKNSKRGEIAFELISFFHLQI